MKIELNTDNVFVGPIPEADGFYICCLFHSVLRPSLHFGRVENGRFKSHGIDFTYKKYYGVWLKLDDVFCQTLLDMYYDIALPTIISRMKIVSPLETSINKITLKENIEREFSYGGLDISDERKNVIITNAIEEMKAQGYIEQDNNFKYYYKVNRK